MAIGQATCPVCGDEFKIYGRKRRLAKQNFCSYKCYWQAKRKHQPWSFERWDEGFVKDGRFMAYVPDHPRASKDGYTFRWIVVYEQTRGCQVNWPAEVVHHRNEDTLDDRPENLELKPFGEHTSLHQSLPEEMKVPQFVERVCAWCRAAFMARKADIKRGLDRFCSLRCSAKARNLTLHGGPVPLRICEVCGQEFEPSSRGRQGREQRFCSVSCASSWNMTQRWRRSKSQSDTRELVAV